MTDTNQKFMQIIVDGATYHIPLKPLGEPAPDVCDLSFRGSAHAKKFRLPMFANGSWFQADIWEAK